MKRTIFISGAGQLGSRYLQGLVKCLSPLSVWVIDPSDASLVQAHDRWKEVGGVESRHSLRLVNSIVTLPAIADLAIVATPASVRADVVASLASRCNVSFWVLEKVLAQTQTDLDRLMESTADANAAWVNIPRRMMRWHQELAEQISKQNPTSLRVFGGNWGLACNSIHLLDLATYLFNETLLSIDAVGLNDNWHVSKRAGFFEINGILKAQFSGGKTAMLNCQDTLESMVIEVETIDGRWRINESYGQAIAPDGKIFPGRLEYQSEMTSGLVEAILNTGGCELPTLDQAVVMHRPFLNALISHWNQTQKNEDLKLPIT